MYKKSLQHGQQQRRHSTVADHHHAEPNVHAGELKRIQLFIMMSNKLLYTCISHGYRNIEETDYTYTYWPKYL